MPNRIDRPFFRESDGADAGPSRFCCGGAFRFVAGVRSVFVAWCVPFRCGVRSVSLRGCVPFLLRGCVPFRCGGAFRFVAGVRSVFVAGCVPFRCGVPRLRHVRFRPGLHRAASSGNFSPPGGPILPARSPNGPKFLLILQNPGWPLRIATRTRMPGRHTN